MVEINLTCDNTISSLTVFDSSLTLRRVATYGVNIESTILDDTLSGRVNAIKTSKVCNYCKKPRHTAKYNRVKTSSKHNNNDKHAKIPIKCHRRHN